MKKKISTATITKLAILTTISFLLYAFGKFHLSFMFPSFLEIQISELPAILGGFALGPISGCLIIIIKCLLKMAMTTTACVGEVVDIIIGISYILPASLIYKYRKNKKGAIIGLISGTAISTVMAMICNRVIAIPFYVTAMFGGSWEPILGMCSVLYPSITRVNFFVIYLFAAILPFNLLRLIIVSLFTFFMYKSLSVILHKEFYELSTFDQTRKEQVLTAKTLRDTNRIARAIAKILVDSDVLLLEGDLGAGKTTFTKALCKKMGFKGEVTSPTFTILNVYETKNGNINHLDMYRVEDSDELYETGVVDTINSGGITVVEWNKYVELEEKAIKIRFIVYGEARKLCITLPENKILVIHEKEKKSLKGDKIESNNKEFVTNENVINEKPINNNVVNYKNLKSKKRKKGEPYQKFEVLSNNYEKDTDILKNIED